MHGESSPGSGCTPCGFGFFLTKTGSTTSDDCQVCPMGTFGATAVEETCTNCPIGTYANATGALECTSCSLGSSTAVTGSLSSSDCYQCPAHLPFSLPGVPCFTARTNLFVASKASSRVVAFNGDTSDFQLIGEGDDIDWPEDVSSFNPHATFSLSRPPLSRLCSLLTLSSRSISSTDRFHLGDRLSPNARQQRLRRLDERRG